MGPGQALVSHLDGHCIGRFNCIEGKPDDASCVVFFLWFHKVGNCHVGVADCLHLRHGQSTIICKDPPSQGGKLVILPSALSLLYSLTGDDNTP